MRKYLSLICIVFLVSGCGNSDTPIPDNVIPIEKMAGILADFELAEVVLNYHIDSVEYFDSVRVGRYYADIFKQHHVEGKDFAESWIFYQKHPALGEKLYEKTLDVLRKQEEQ